MDVMFKAPPLKIYQRKTIFEKCGRKTLLGLWMHLFQVLSSPSLLVPILSSNLAKVYASARTNKNVDSW
jgi:hypothetical protein